MELFPDTLRMEHWPQVVVTTRLLLQIFLIQIPGWRAPDLEKLHPVQAFLQAYLPLELSLCANQKVLEHIYQILHLFLLCSHVIPETLLTQMTRSMAAMARPVSPCWEETNTGYDTGLPLTCLLCQCLIRTQDLVDLNPNPTLAPAALTTRRSSQRWNIKARTLYLLEDLLKVFWKIINVPHYPVKIAPVPILVKYFPSLQNFPTPWWYLLVLDCWGACPRMQEMILFTTVVPIYLSRVMRNSARMKFSILLKVVSSLYLYRK